MQLNQVIDEYAMYTDRTEESLATLTGIAKRIYTHSAVRDMPVIIYACGATNIKNISPWRNII
ncbi:MAG: hypothetical protein COA42_14655 [Alteromonadaceae bacterium]|nr:MAG: hypothetical protein COA42_14655 [Alteromonadaceae bacterium]